MSKIDLHPDRLFPGDETARNIARALYNHVRDAPIISPHGHTDPEWFAQNQNFANATDFFLVPDHYVLRMLYSQGVSMQDLGVPYRDQINKVDPRKAWQLFGTHYHLFRGTPSRIWLDYVFSEVFGLEEQLSADTAGYYFDSITAALQTDAYKPRAILDRFKIKYLATTEGALDLLPHHAKLNADGYGHRVVSTFRPDDVIDPDREDFRDNLEQLAILTHEDLSTFNGYLNALRNRRDYYISMGVRATDHGHPTARTLALGKAEIEALYQICRSGRGTLEDHENFRAHMLMEMARMSIEDGLVMQLHPGSYRNHNPEVFRAFGRDKGADIPQAITYTEALKPLLDELGNRSDFTLILFTLDETNYARELAPLAGHYPCLRLGPPWWFHDSVEGMIRFRQQVTETAGFYNTAGFNDDTRSLLSIPARHDVARRMDCRFLGQLVSEHRLHEDEAFDLIGELTTGLVTKAYRLEDI